MLKHKVAWATIAISASEADARAKLNGPRAARAEDLREAGTGLAEPRRVGEFPAVPDEVGGVEQVEDFAEQGEAYALASEWEGTAQTQEMCVCARCTCLVLISMNVES